MRLADAPGDPGQGLRAANAERGSVSKWHIGRAARPVKTNGNHRRIQPIRIRLALKLYRVVERGIGGSVPRPESASRRWRGSGDAMQWSLAHAD